MRAGANCAAPQTLSAEAASVLKHSLSLARRRGHAQVTPLHVAATLLSSRTSLLHRACLTPQSVNQPSHPLQCRALELCFNVALNRLPATAGGPIFHTPPSLSNALVAALKRAQAHQRRGCVEQNQQQQQPLIAIKVELEQLILSILDDPSVSRVMREAGFSSAAVKNNLEEAANSVSSVFQSYNMNTCGGIYSTPNSPPHHHQRDRHDNQAAINPSNFWNHIHLPSYTSEQNPILFSPQKNPLTSNATTIDTSSSLKEDIKVVFEVFTRKKRRNTVLVGDSLSMAEGLVAELKKKVERGSEDVPDELKSANFIKFQFSSITVPSLGLMKREQVLMHIAELKRKLDSFGSSTVIIYIGDLKWTVEIDDDRERGFCSGKEELGINNNVYRPVDHLVAEMGKLLSLYNDSCSSRVWLMATANYQTYMKCQMKQPPLDVQWSLQPVSVPSGGLGLSLNNSTSGLYSRFNFLQNPCQDLEKKPFSEQLHALSCCPECTSNYEKEKSFSLRSINKDSEKDSCQLPFWLQKHGPNEPLMEDDLALRRKYNKLCQSLHQGSHSNQSYLGKNYHFPSTYPSWKTKNSNIFADSETISFANYHVVKPNQSSASSMPKFRRQQSCHIEFSFSNEGSKYQPKLDSLRKVDDKEVKITLALGNSTYNDQTDLHGVFQENIPWQSETIPLILEALTDHSKRTCNQDKFILIKGNDFVGKRRLAVGIAQSLFGSSDLIFVMNLRKNTNTASENSAMLEKALRDHEKLVILVEDVEFADPELVKFLDDVYERDTSRAIFIFTMGDKLSHSKVNDKMGSVIQMKLMVSEFNPDHKRKAVNNWYSSPNKSKSPRNEMEEVSSNALDLNMKVVANDDEGKHGEMIESISNDEQQSNSPSFFGKIKNCFVLDRNPDQEKRARDMFLSKFMRSFEEVSGNSNFIAEEMVLEEILQSSGLYLNNLFEKWLEEVFETSLRMLDSGEKEKVTITLCLGGKGVSCREDDGFMGTCLPKRIQLVPLTG